MNCFTNSHIGPPVDKVGSPKAPVVNIVVNLIVNLVVNLVVNLGTRSQAGQPQPQPRRRRWLWLWLSRTWLVHDLDLTQDLVQKSRTRPPGPGLRSSTKN